MGLESNRKIVRTLTTIGMWLPLAAQAQPSIPVGGILNAGSYATPGQAHYGIAPGSVFVLYGSGLGPVSPVQVSSYPLPGSEGLAGTSLLIRVNGVSRYAWMLYTSPSQVTAVLPSDTPAGDGTFAVTFNGQTSSPSPVRVVASSFGIFTRSQNGRGRAILQNADSSGNLLLNDLGQAANPGQTVVLWGTGLGSVAGDEAAGPLPAPHFDPTIYVGGKLVRATYAGRSGCCAGLDQIVFVIPDNVEGCYVPVVVGSGNLMGNYATISVARSGTFCGDSGLTPAAFDKLARGERVVAASGVLSHIANADVGVVSFLTFDPDRPLSVGTVVGLPPAGACQVLHLNTDPSGTPSPSALPVPKPSPFVLPLVIPEPAYLSAGSSVSLNGPGGLRQLLPAGLSPYALVLNTASQSYLTSGNYAIDSGGGPDIGAFHGSLTFSPTLLWTNPVSLAQSYSVRQPLSVTWTGGDPAKELVMINGTLSVMSLGASSRGLVATGFFTCVERIEAGQFTIPAYVLEGLPDQTGAPFLAGGLPGNPRVSTGSLSVSSISRLDQNMFIANGLDLGYFVAMSMNSLNVQFVP